MKQSTNEQLDQRIESFIMRKHQQYPKLALRESEKQHRSKDDSITNKFHSLMTSTFSAKATQ